jgi:hypothetical protein
MGHLVVYEAADHAMTYQPCEDLADAVSLVETLRNERGLEHVQIMRTEEIRFDFRPYYRVQLGEATSPISQPAALPADTSVASAETAAPAQPLPSMVAAPVEEHLPSPSAGYDEADDFDEDDPVGSGIRRGLFGR